MGFFGKSKSGPPDVGQEDEYDGGSGSVEDKDDGEDDSKAIAVSKGVRAVGGEGGASVPNVEFERLSARVESVVEWLHQFSERFAYINESIGEVRAATLATEKKLSQAMMEADKVIDIVHEVKPDELRIAYQKMELKLSAVSEKIDANKQLMLDTVGEVNDIRQKSEVFVGTEALIKMNQDTKKDAVNAKKLASRMKMQADKVQEIFADVNKSFSETQKSMQEAEDIRENFEIMKKDIEKLRLDQKKVVSRDDLAKIQRSVIKTLSDMKNTKQGYERMNQVSEMALSFAQQNKDDIGNLAIKVGDKSAKKIVDYEVALNDVLGLVSMLTEQVNALKQHTGIQIRNDSMTDAVNAVANKAGVNAALVNTAVVNAVPVSAVPINAVSQDSVVLPAAPVASPQGTVESVSEESVAEPIGTADTEAMEPIS